MTKNSHYERLPIYKAAMDLVVNMDKIVRIFPHAQKYSLGNEMKIISINILKLVVQANTQKDRLEKLNELCLRGEELKLLCNIGKEVGAFKSFKQFMLIIELVMNLIRQAEGWKKTLIQRRPEPLI